MPHPLTNGVKLKAVYEGEKLFFPVKGGSHELNYVRMVPVAGRLA